jgi:hypothetical protein
MVNNTNITSNLRKDTEQIFPLYQGLFCINAKIRKWELIDCLFSDYFQKAWNDGLNE